jgi:hypothetical protein
MKKHFLYLIAALPLFMLTAGCAQSVDLFNGKDLSNWNFVLADESVPAEQVFSVDNGTILVQGVPFGYMYTKEKYSDYRLSVEWTWVDEASNSGIFLLITDAVRPFPRGIECQLKAGSAGDFVMLSGASLEEYVAPEGTERPAFPQMKKRVESNESAIGEWNRAVVEVRGGKIDVYINDVLQNSGTSPDKAGYIGLQSEGGKIRFRNVRLVKL